jgi:hypothetical protein
MRKGVILEINDLYLTLLTPEGEFLRARKLQQDYQVGEEIHFFPETLTVKEKKFIFSFLNSFRAKTIALAATFMLIMAGLLPAYEDGQVYAYMSIDVNPSIELAVNDDLKVLHIKGYNPEGEEILRELKDWKKKDAAFVAEMILDEIEEEGFFKEKHDVVIATVHTKKAKESVDRKLEKKIAEIKNSAQEDLNFKVMEATTEDRQKAQKQGVTTGIYKEKQKATQKPAAKPVKQDKKASPEPEKENPAPPVVVPQPEKKEPPGQEKKKDPAIPKGNQNKEKAPSTDNGKGNNNSSKNGNGQGNVNKQPEKNDKYVIKNEQNKNHRKNEKKSNTQHPPKSDNRGQAGKNKDKPGK